MASMNKYPLTQADSRFRGRERFFLLYVELVDTFLENKLIFFLYIIICTQLPVAPRITEKASEESIFIKKIYSFYYIDKELLFIDVYIH